LYTVVSNITTSFPNSNPANIVLVRLNKLISDAGICSRREADRKIEAGKVRVNGKLAQLGDLVSHSDRILVSGNPVEMRSEHVYLAYNKPIGITTTTDRADPDNILKALAYHGGRVFPVGRLDKDSEGLILFTDDGDIVNKILRTSNKHDKEYIVFVDKPVTPGFIRQMAEGVSILGVTTRRCTVEKINKLTFRIVLNQGMNRQIRRMCKVLGYAVTRLQRIRVMNINLDGIATGTWRFLTDSEKASLLKAVEGSRKEAAAPTPRKRSVSGDTSKSGSGKSATGKPRNSRNRSEAKNSGNKKSKMKGARKTTDSLSSGTTRSAPKPGRSTTRNVSKPATKSTSKPKRTSSRTKK
jgi:23S rRNA pseudouridine2604 synthase